MTIVLNIKISFGVNEEMVMVFGGQRLDKGRE